MVVAVSSVLYVMTLLASGRDVQIAGGGLSILAPSGRSLLLFGMSGAYPVYVEGAWWTLLSASWLHGNLLHILFNMYWVRRLGPDAVELFGPARTVIVYTVGGAVGFLVSSTAGYLGVPIPLLHGASFTVGASASILALLGAIAHYGHRGGSRLIRSQVTELVVIFAVMGLLMPGTDNYAHAGGFLGGYAVAAALDPFARERFSHLLLAAACLGASALAVVLSLLHGALPLPSSL